MGWPGLRSLTLEHGDVLLRPIRYRDRSEWTQLRARNAAWLGPWDATDPRPGGIAPSYGQMVQALRAQAREHTGLPLVITERQAGPGARPALVGQLNVSSIVWGSARTATLGYWVDRDRAGRGIVPTAVALATDYCFGELGLHRMEINIRPENGPSLRVVQKLGFRDEGLRQRFLHINGRWCDHRSFALTAEEVPEGLLSRLQAGSGAG